MLTIRERGEVRDKGGLRNEDEAFAIRRSRFWRFLVGPRFIDAPIRLFLLINAIWSCMPSAFESNQTWYVVLHYAATVLFVVVGFFPVSAGMAGLVLGAVFLILFPNYISPFETVMEFSVGVLLTWFRWVPALLFLAANIVLNWVFSDAFGETLMEKVTFFGYEYAVVFVVTLSAGALEQKVRREMRVREENVRSQERDMQALKIGLALDAHDSISHGLATEAAIIRMLVKNTRFEEQARELTQLALVNKDTEVQLQQLLSRLRAQELSEESETVPFALAVRSAVESMKDAVRTCGFALETEYHNLPVTADLGAFKETQFLLRELIANMVKHGDVQGACWLRIEGQSIEGGILLGVNAGNQVDAPLEGGVNVTPRTLKSRVERLGGSFETLRNDEIFEARMQIVLRRT